MLILVSNFSTKPSLEALIEVSFIGSEISLYSPPAVSRIINFVPFSTISTALPLFK